MIAQDHAPPLSEKAASMRYSLGLELTALALTLTAALLSDSLTLWANTIRVGLDALATTFAFAVTRRIARGLDERFDYGLGKWENLSALVNASVMVVAFFFISYQTIHRLRHPANITGAGFGVSVLMVAAAVNFWMFGRFGRLRKNDPSPVVNAQFLLYRNATAGSVFSLLAVLGAIVSPDRRIDVLLDVGGATIIAGVIFHSMFTLLRQSLAALLDQALEESLQLRVMRALAETFPEYNQLHRVRTRRSGSRIFVDLFLEFPVTLTAAELLERSGRIKALVERLVPESETWVIPLSPPTSES